MKQAGIKITYAGVDITQWMYVQMVERDVGTNHVNTMQKVGISDGQMLQYMSRDVKTIVVTGIVMNDDLVPLRRSLAAAIDADEPQQLIFGDEPDKYYLAIVDSQPTLTEGFRSGTISISFVCPDGGIAHSIAIKTFDNINDDTLSNTITVHNGGTYPVEPVITATMHADNGFLGFANSHGGVLQFGNPEEIDGYTSEESEVALNLTAVKGSHMDNQAASNNLYWGGSPATPNEQIGNAIWTEDKYDGWKVEPNWLSITGDHKYWNGPSIKHNLAQTHNGNFKSNLTWDVMTRFQTGVAQVGALETTLESDGKPIFQMILKDNSALSDQIWWMCYYKNQLVVNEQLDRNIFTNDKFIQLELQKFGNSVVFRVSPWVGNRGRETTITRQFTFADAADVETKQFSTWFMRDKTWGESTMYLIASTVKWQNVSWYTDIKNRFSNGDVITIDVANTKTYFNGSEDRTLHTLGNQWDKFLLPPGDTTIQLMPSSWAQPFECEVYLKEAWL